MFEVQFGDGKIVEQYAKHVSTEPHSVYANMVAREMIREGTVPI